MVVSNFAHADEPLLEKGQIAEADYMQKLSAESAEYQAMLRKLAKYGRLQRFIEALKKDIYPEPLAEPHNSITRKMVSKLLTRDDVKPGDKVLDVGCGQGLALDLFKEAGLNPTGITLGEDYGVCKTKGLNVYEMDQSFLEFEDGEFDIVWCRHSIEHSVFPLFTLSEFYRVLKEAGLLYIEVPAPDTSCHHERNQNHYSVLGKSMWVSLFNKSNLENVSSFDINFQVPAEQDMYWSFLLRRGS
jgi:SAM-dependent methyltransferase